MTSCQIFISYRRENGGDKFAFQIYQRLVQEGYDVFFDTDSIGKGKFDEQIFTHIDHSSAVILVLPPDALKRCEIIDDWLRLEIEHAMTQKKPIIPVMMKGFSWPQKATVPETISDVMKYQAVQEPVVLSTAYFETMMRELLSYIAIKPNHIAAQTGQTSEVVDHEKIIRLRYLMEDGDVKGAEQLADEILERTIQCPQAYMTKLLIEMNLQNEDQLDVCYTPFEERKNWKRAIEWAEEPLKEQYLKHLELAKSYRKRVNEKIKSAELSLAAEKRKQEEEAKRFAVNINKRKEEAEQKRKAGLETLAVSIDEYVNFSASDQDKKNGNALKIQAMVSELKTIEDDCSGLGHMNIREEARKFIDHSVKNRKRKIGYRCEGCCIIMALLIQILIIVTGIIIIPDYFRKGLLFQAITACLAFVLTVIWLCVMACTGFCDFSFLFDPEETDWNVLIAYCFSMLTGFFFPITAMRFIDVNNIWEQNTWVYIVYFVLIEVMTGSYTRSTAQFGKIGVLPWYSIGLTGLFYVWSLASGRSWSWNGSVSLFTILAIALVFVVLFIKRMIAYVVDDKKHQVSNELGLQICLEDQEE